MKKNLLFAYLATVVTLSSCSEDSIINQNLKDICFNAYVNSSTKASITDVNNFKEFTVFTYSTPNFYEGGAILGSPYIDALSVSREDNVNQWTYEGNYFWPNDGAKLQVFAVSPMDNLVSEYSISENSYPSFKYEVGHSVDKQKDLVASCLLNQVKSENNKSLNLYFKHILSQINFSIKGELLGLKYHISKIELLNLKDKGTFTFDYPLKIGEWSDVNGSVNYVYNLSDFVVEGITVKPLKEANKTMILMPQRGTKNVKIRVTYYVTENNGGSMIFDGSKEICLSDFNLAMGSNIRYILTLPIDSDDISFMTINESWDK